MTSSLVAERTEGETEVGEDYYLFKARNPTF